MPDATDQSSAPRTSSKARFPILRWVAVLYMLPAVLYIAWVLGQLRDIEERNQRMLGRSAEKIAVSLEVARDNVEGLAEDFRLLERFDQRQPHLTLDDDADDQAAIQRLIDIDTGLIEVPIQAVPAGEEVEAQRVERERVEQERLECRAELGLVVQAHYHTDSRGAALHGSVSEPPAAESVAEGCRSFARRAVERLEPVVSLDPAFAFRLDTDALVDERTLGAAFEHLLLVSGEGHVLSQENPVVPFEERPGGDRVLDLSRLEARPAGWLAWDDAQVDEVLTPADLQGSSTLHQVSVSGRSYELYCQPFPIQAVDESHEREGGETQDLATAGDPGTWALCGLSRPNRYLRQALSVAPNLAMALLVFVVLGVLALPLAKLALIHRRERLRLVDCYLLLAVTFFALLLLPALLVSADSYRALQARQEKVLERLAREVDGRLGRHLSTLFEQLDHYDRMVCEDARGPGEPPSRDRLMSIRRTDLWRNPSDFPAVGLDPRPVELPPPGLYTSVFWMDPDGMQVAKATVRDRNTQVVSLAQRPYFQAIRDGTGWMLPGAEHGRPIYYQTYASVTTGERSTALSTPSRLSAPSCDGTTATMWRGTGRRYVAAITSRPPWLLEPVLPHGIAFAVIDADGSSLFHSVGSRALEENLFDELSEQRRLRAAMTAGAMTHFGGRYRTVPHLGFVMPARAGPWWIVTLADSSVVGSINVEALGQMAIGGGVYALMMGLVLAAIAFGSRGGGTTWLWPNRENGVLHRRLACVSLALVVIFVLVCAVDSLEIVQAAAYWLPLLAVATYVGLVVYRKLERDPATLPRRLRPYWKAASTAGVTHRLRWYVAASFLGWLVLAVLPGVALFKAAWGDQNRALVKLEGAEFLEHATERARWLDTEFLQTTFRVEGVFSRQDVYGRAWMELSALHRAASIFDTRPFDKATFAAAGPDPQGGDSISSGPLLAESHPPDEDREPIQLEGLRFGDNLARYKPVYSPIVGKLRHRRDSAAYDRGLSWWLEDDEVRMTTDGVPPQVRMSTVLAPVLDVQSNWAARPRIRVGRMAVGGFAVLLGALLFWVRWATSRIFFARIGSRVGEPGNTLEELLAVERSAIALVPSPLDRHRLVTMGNPVVDLGAAAHERTEAAVSRLEPEGRQHVVCINFSDKLDDRSERQWKLRQLERLVYEGKKRVIIRTAVSPLEDLFWRQMSDEDDAERPTCAKSSTAIRLDSAEAQSWGRVLSHFIVFPVAAEPPSVDGGELAELFHARLPQGHGRALEKLERQIELFEGYYWALWTSCSPDEQLVLVHLAQERFVNPKQEPTVRRLLQKGLLKRSPRLRPMDDAFALFVRRIHEPVEIARWEHSGEGLRWGQFRWAFISVLAVVAIFLIATQQELMDVTFGFLSALVVGGLPALLELYGRVRRSTGRSYSA